jgi:hypothetical protein
MKATRRWLPIAAVAIVLGLALAMAPSVRAESTLVPKPGMAATDDAANGLVLYYFHGAKRCNTCRSIESQTRDAIEGKFAAELEAGTLQWKVLNTDEPENEHFLKDFDLVGSSLVLVEMKGDSVVRHEILQDVWTLVRDEPRFRQYVQRSVDGYLN